LKIVDVILRVGGDTQILCWFQNTVTSHAAADGTKWPEESRPVGYIAGECPCDESQFAQIISKSLDLIEIEGMKCV
jgi:hypothetical protein